MSGAAEIDPHPPGARPTISIVSLSLLGFSLGMRHATDPDHVVAVAAIVCRAHASRSRTDRGHLGFGHTLTILVVGGAIVLFGIVIPPRVGLTMELSVALLLAMEARTLARHEDHVPSEHAHDAALAPLDQRLGHLRTQQLVRPLVVGVVHGLAGSAAVALLVLGTIRDPLGALAYVAAFGVGTIAGMLVITTLLLAVPFAFAARRAGRLHRTLGLAAGLLSLGFGAFLVYRIGFVDGLFTGAPHWTPE